MKYTQCRLGRVFVVRFDHGEDFLKELTGLIKKKAADKVFTFLKIAGSCSTGVISLKRIPGFGKSGTSRILDFRSWSIFISFSPHPQGGCFPTLFPPLKKGGGGI